MDKTELLKLIEKKLNELLSLGFKPKVGAELEFYLERDSENIDDFSAELLKHCDRIEMEKGWHQMESIIEYETDPLKLPQKILDLRYALTQLARKYAWEVDFRGKPHEDDYGSALHLHISLHNRHGFNFFSENSIENNELLMQSIAGLLEVGFAGVALLVHDETDYLRFSPKFMAPTHVSWGINNRTTIIRIPNSHVNNRRIEFRLPPANACPFITLYILLTGVLYGIKNKLTPPSQTWGNAYDDQYNLKQLPKTFQEAKNNLLNSNHLSEFKHEV